jgi:hypothetical protein
MVGGLVQNDQVVFVDEQLGQGRTAPLTTGQAPGERDQVDVAEQAGEDLADARVTRPFVLGPAAEDDVLHRPRRVEVVALRQRPHLEASAVRDPPAVVGLEITGDH